MTLFGAIEAGGTKFHCAVGRAHDDIAAQTTLPTTTPKETFGACIAFFREAISVHGPIKALGVAAFGPLDLDEDSPTFGSVLATPKPGWSGADFRGTFEGGLGAPMVIDTDVNGAVLAEVKFGAGQGCDSVVYVTVGTGIGGGIFVGGRPQHGLVHPEVGHIALPRSPGDEAFESVCSFHTDCLEGLASGPAIARRAGKPAQDLAQDHPAWDHEVFYLAHMCRTITCMLSPQKIILGGGVMAYPGLLARVQQAFPEVFGDYLPVAARAGGIDNYIVGQTLAGVSGLAGAFALARG